MKLRELMDRAVSSGNAVARRALPDMMLGRGQIRRAGAGAPIFLAGGVLDRQELGPGQYTYWCGTPGRAGTYSYGFTVA